MSTRSHRPALVKAQDLKGAPRGQYSSKVSSTSSSASPVGEVVSGILPSNDEDMKVVAISKASELQDDLTDKINSQDFKTLFGGWDPKAECQEYLKGLTGRTYKRGKGIPVTPTPDPEMQVDPLTNMPTTHQNMSQPYQPEYAPQQEYQYPQNYQNYLTAGQYWNQPSQYHPQPVMNTGPGQSHQGETNNRPPSAGNCNCNCNRNANWRNQEYRAPNNFRPMSTNGRCQRTNSQTAGENRRVAYQRSIHQEMI
ncbi:hypothetical protein PGT21_011071 [Puccinia graminis f. sp. tritici]|uniref:Uncharacterized protein n=1 Tax=Puccinia graminis f. sp. tritici TaxID=56615 RepID=A0A5B0MEE5_PUCGR|nr:hypothetical protein PGT21_011071 [Puccinia graminis f. sp. tritici]